MEDEKAYFAVFFDVDLPALPHNARQVRLSRQKFINIIDEAIPDKTIDLIDKKGKTEKYSLVSWRGFHLTNSIDNTMFLICDVKKVK